MSVTVPLEMALGPLSKELSSGINPTPYGKLVSHNKFASPLVLAELERATEMTDKQTT